MPQRDAPGGGIDFTQVGAVGPSSTQFTHNIEASLLDEGTHTYTVRLVVDAWESPDSNTDSVEVLIALGIYTCG